MLSNTLLFALMAVATAPTPQALVDEFQRQTVAFDNVSLQATWEELSKSLPTRWEEQIIHMDNLGRYRMITRAGPYDEHLNRSCDVDEPDETDRIFDGEMTVTLNYYSNKDRVGNAVDPSDQNAGYRAAQVHDGKFPKHGINNYRSPLTFAITEVVVGLIESLAANREISLVASPEERGLYQLTLMRDPGREVQGSVRSVILLDPAKGWLPVRVDAVDNEGRIVRRTTCEYSKTANGFWVPMRGSKRHYGERTMDDGPLWETRFETQQITLNDPDFDETVFQTTLEPDTAVSDIRYGVNYRVGAEKVFDADLTRLAQEALEKVKQATDITHETQRSWRGWIIAANVGVVLLLFLLVVVKKMRSA